MEYTKDGLDIIFGRRSIRRYKQMDVEDEKLQKILEAGMAAPSAVAKDPWHFIVSKNPETLKEVSKALPNGQMLGKASAGFIVCGDIEQAHSNQTSYMLQDCAAAIENMLIAAHALGLGACWLGVHPREKRITHIQNVFQLPENIIPISCISLGYPEEQKSPRTRYDSNKVHYEKW